MEETGYVMRTEFQHAPLDYIMFFYSIFFNSSVTNGRLEEKLSNLESDNQVLRQQALTILATAKALYARPKTPTLQVSIACNLSVVAPQMSSWK